MNGYEGPEIGPIITWYAKLNRAQTVHAFTEFDGWSLCGAVGRSQVGVASKDARRCGRCTKALKRRDRP